MADTSNLTNFLTDVADAIRTKKEITKEIILTKNKIIDKKKNSIYI